MVLTTEHIEKHRKGKYAKVTKRTEGHYEAQEVEFGTVYKWCPECLVVACECGEKMTLTPLYAHLCRVRHRIRGYRPRTVRR
jgi:hypothetical protein